MSHPSMCRARVLTSVNINIFAKMLMMSYGVCNDKLIDCDMGFLSNHINRLLYFNISWPLLTRCFKCFLLY